MDAFEENLQVFNNTIYGPEMRKALFDCFELIRVKINYHAIKIQDASDKINKLEGGS